MDKISWFARPLGWIVDLELSGRDARIVAQFLRDLPHPKRYPAWPYSAIAVWAQLNLDALAALEVPEQKLLLLDLRASRQRVLPRVIARCAVLDGYISLVGISLVARGTYDPKTRSALRRLTRDRRIHERLAILE
jgi:hypothetical protein